MDIEIIGGDPYGNEAYAKLFDDIMSDLNKAVLIDTGRPRPPRPSGTSPPSGRTSAACTSRSPRSATLRTS